MATAKQIDFSNVKEGGNFNKKRIPAGDYLAKITKVEDAKAKADGKFQYLFSIKIQKYPSSVLPYYVKLEENQLWKLRNLLIAAGKSVPKSKIKVDPNQLVGKVIGVTVGDTEYDDKEQSQIDGVFPAAELADDPSQAPIDDDSEEAPEEDEDDAPLADMDMDDDVEEEAEEADDEAEDEADEEEAGPYADLSRVELKAELKKLKSDIQVRKSQTDDDLRELLVKMTADAAKKRKPSAKDVSDDELDELDIDAI